MSDTLRNCPKCGGPIPNEAPQGLCPKCVLEQASFATESGQPTEHKPAPPSLEELALAFPHLQVIEMVGQGGMGFVFKARQPKLERFVALKILPQTLALDPAFAQRFQREARVLAKLNHPNIVTIFDFGQAGGFFFLLMEFVDGVNLREAMKVGRFTPAQALDIVPKICDALHFAHNEGILHRDIKPENILLDSRGRVKIADFGIAKILGVEGNETKAVAPQQQNVTGIVGTPNYMAPEQIERPSEVDQRADIYSLGVVFYEMLTGELPTGAFVPPSKKSPVDPRVDDVVQRTLERERERRQRSADEVRTQVETIVDHPQNASTALPREYDYRSKRSFMGLPLIHVTWGFEGDKIRTAKGWVAVGPRAIGAAAVGLEAFGLLPFGMLSVGLLPVGGLAVGAVATGLLAFGLEATGLFAAGDSATAVFRIHSGLAAFWTLFFSYIMVRLARRAVMKQLQSALPAGGAPPVIGGSRTGAPAPDRFWRKFAVVIAALIALPALIAFLAMLAAIVIPALSKAQKKAQITRAIPVAPTAPKPGMPAIPAVPAKPAGGFSGTRKLSTRAFSPVIERTIQAPASDSKTNMFLDLTHGKIFTPPVSIVEVIEKNGPDVQRTWTTRDIASDQRAYRYVRWVEEHGIDLMFLPPSNEYNEARVVTFDCMVTPAHGENSTNWEDMDALTPQQLERAIGVLDYMRAFKEAQRYGRPLPPAPPEGGIFNSAIQLDSTNPEGPKVNALTLKQSRLWFFETRTGARGILELSEINKDPWSAKIRYKLLQAAKRAQTVDLTHKQMAFARPELEVTNDVMTVSVSSDTALAPGQHFSAILEMPSGEMRTHMFSVVTNGTKTSSLISWDFDPKRDGFWKAAAQDALMQMSTTMAKPHTFHAGEVMPVFAVTNSNGGVMTGSIEYHVHLPQAVPAPAESMASTK